jgi:acyl-CoA synthetase (AMP-forming)/AMP-acid ligase II
VSPLEVDDVLMDHPAIAQVVTFAMPHEKLGEEVACAVVLREGQAATEQEIRGFASGRLADFKVPRKVVILEEIPKGATGKLQRIGLAQKLGLGA